MLSGVVSSSYGIAWSSSRQPCRSQRRLCVATTDRQLSFETATDRKIGRQGMGFGVGDEPVDVLFDALSRSPVQRNTEIPQIKAMDSVNEWSIPAASSIVWRARSTA